MNNAQSGQARGLEGSPTQVQSVDRALTILEYSPNTAAPGVTEIAKSLDVHKSTAFRLVVALETANSSSRSRSAASTGSASG